MTDKEFSDFLKKMLNDLESKALDDLCNKALGEGDLQKQIGGPTGAPTYTYTKGIPLYRKVLNSGEVARWYATQGVPVDNPEDLRLEIACCFEPILDKSFVIPEGDSISGAKSRKLMEHRNGFGVHVSSDKLGARQKKLQENGTGWRWEEYHPEIRLATKRSHLHANAPSANTDKLSHEKALDKPLFRLQDVEDFPGPIYFSPEAYDDVWENQEMDKTVFDEPLIMGIPAIIKADMEDGRRIIKVEASCEKVDLEGDVILQKALLDSADSFVKNGHLDIDHKSEAAVAFRLGISNPEFYIVGKPLEVSDGGNKRTFVKGELSKARDGSFDPEHRMSDMVWDSLHRNPPVDWYASIYGMPRRGMVKNCRTSSCELGATRFLVSGIDWKSLALTRRPVNNMLTGNATILTAKAWIDFMVKGTAVVPGTIGGTGAGFTGVQSAVPTASGIMAKGHACQNCGNVLHRAPSVNAWKRHLVGCEGVIPPVAELYAKALMYETLLRNLGVD